MPHNGSAFSGVRRSAATLLNAKDPRRVPRINNTKRSACPTATRCWAAVRDELVRWPLEYCESNLKLSRAPAEWVSVDHDP